MLVDATVRDNQRQARSVAEQRHGGTPGLSSRRRQELTERLLRAASPSGAVGTSIGPASRQRPLPLSFAQQRVWFLDRLRPGSADYIAPWVWRLTGPLDTDALRAAWTELVRRHEILRTRYAVVDGDVRQLIDPPVPVAIPLVDLSSWPPLDRDREADALTGREFGQPFDLERDAPLRLRLLRLDDETHLLIFAIHHIAFDGWSVGLLARELGRLYAGFVAGRPELVIPPAIQYADFAAWQREWAAGDAMVGQLSYWRKQLAGLTPLEIATDRPRPRVLDTSGAVTMFTVPAQLARGLRELGRARRATPFMVFLAAFQLLLARYSGQHDITVGTPIAGRTKPDLQEMLGFFVNTLVVRTDLGGDPSFAELLDRVRIVALGAYANQDVPFERLVTELAPDRDLSHNPLLSHLFILQNNETADFAGAGLTARSLPVSVDTAKFDLTLQLIERPDGSLDGIVEYATALFDRVTAERLAGHYLQLLHAIQASPQARIAQLRMLSDSERQQLLERTDEADRPVADVTAIELIQAQVRRTPAAVAVVSRGVELSYAELDARTNRLAHDLRALGAGPGTLVAIVLDRGLDLITALLAVMKSGATYLPIDPDYPSARIDFLLTDAGAQLVVTQQSLQANLAESAATTVVLDGARDRDRIQARPADPLPSVATPGDIAYLIYTSGSTGTPKGVMVQHRALTNFLLSMAQRPGLTATDTLVAVTTVSFDISALELYLPLVVGARLVLADAEQARDPHRIAALASAAESAVVQATPTTWRMVLDAGWTPPAGTTVLCGGEKLPLELAEKLVADGATVWDLYGPTEATIWASTARLDSTGRVADWATVANTTAYLLDSQLQLVPQGVIGELYLGGAAVAYGYLRRPSLTATRFIPDPYGDAGSRLYRTGDLARRHRDGSVEILGRTDQQVKLRGFRIELGEIEARLRGVDAVTEAVVVVREDTPGDRRLVAYLVALGAQPDVADLRIALAEALPSYMIPAAFVFLPALPLTANGKVDTGALPVPGAVQHEVTGRYVAPRDQAEQHMCALFAEVLGIDKVGAEDDFFILGGHSLLAIQVVIRLRDALDVDVPVRELFDHSTAAAMATLLRSYPASQRRPDVPVLKRRERRGQRSTSTAGGST
jgi:amino acid adenylation domain-containing protein